MKSNRAFEILSTLSYELCYCEVDESIIDYSNAVRAVEEAENEVIDLLKESILAKFQNGSTKDTIKIILEETIKEFKDEK